MNASAPSANPAVDSESSPTRLDTGVPEAPLVSTASLWLSGVLLLVTDLAAGLTAFGGLLSGPDVMVGSAKGTALVLLFATTPVLAASMFFAARGSVRGVVVWLGALAAVLYNTQMLLYATPFNSLFLLYVTMLGLTVWSIVWLLRGDMIGKVAGSVDPAMPVRMIAGYLWVVAGLNAAIWLRTIVPAVLSSDPTTVLAGTGVATNPVFIQDLALWLPLAIAAGVGLWRHRPAGYLIAGGMLTMWVLESISIGADQWFGHRSDPASPVASGSMVLPFLGLAVIGLIPLVMHLLHVAPRR